MVTTTNNNKSKTITMKFPLKWLDTLGKFFAIPVCFPTHQAPSNKGLP